MQNDLPFKLGLVIYGSYPDVLKDTDQLLNCLTTVAVDQTFDLVEMPIVDDESLWPLIRDIVRESGIDVVAAAGPSCIVFDWNLSSPDPGKRQIAVEGMQKAIDYAYAIKARQLVFISGKDPGESERDRARAALCDSIATLIEYARQNATDYILTLSLEAADRSLEHCQLIGSPAEAVDILVRTGKTTASINVTLDMSHIPQLGETLAVATQTLGGLVGHAHIANALVRDSARKEYGDKHPRFGLPGGEFDAADITRFIQLLFEHCFQEGNFFPYGRPAISLEVKPTEGIDPAIGLAGAKRVLAAACRQLNS